MAPSLCGLVYTAALLGVLSEVALVPVVQAGGRTGSAMRRQNGHRRRDHVAPQGQQREARATIAAEAAAEAAVISDDSLGEASMLLSKRQWRVDSRRSRGRRGWVRGGRQRASRAPASAGWVVGLRGGSTVEGVGEVSTEEATGVVRSVKVLVSTTKISSFIDARGEIAAQSDWTVGRLKEELEKKFPGNIPASVQRLFKGTQLLPSSMTLEEASEGAEGPLSLILDNAPPIDSSRFDPDTAVPSRRDGQVEAFSASIGGDDDGSFSRLKCIRRAQRADDPELTRSVKMKADFENTQALLQRTLDEVPDTGVEEQETFGIFHETLRPLAHRLDVNWMQSLQQAVFIFVCAQFGASGAIRRGVTLMLIPMIFLAQTRTARVGAKLARNLVAEVPVLTQLILGLLQAPTQVIMSTDTEAYTRDLYGPGGPKYGKEFVTADGDGESGEGEGGEAEE
ncbi:unnamed protein product [Scytosiphon promiscuus]